MPNNFFSKRYKTTISVLVILYGLILLGTFFWLANTLKTSTGLPRIQNRLALGILAVPSFILTVFTLFEVIKFIREYNKKRWGYKTKLHVLIYFIISISLAAIPPIGFFSIVTNRAINTPFSNDVKKALSMGLKMILSYYSEQEASLKYLAENNVKSMLSTAKVVNLNKVFSRISEYNHNICAIELFYKEKSIEFEGDINAKLERISLQRNGFLPRLSVGSSSYIRYFIKDSGFVVDGVEASAVISLLFSDELEKTALAFSQTLLDLQGTEQGSFLIYLIIITFIFAVPFFVLALLFAIIVSDKLLQPSYALFESIEKLKQGSKRVPFLAKPGDEAGDIIENLNIILEKLERSRADEVHTEKTSAWKDIAQKLAHELKNPLTPIRLSAERVLKRWKNEPSSIDGIIEKSMVAIIQETASMDALLSEFKNFARLPEPQKNWMDLKLTVDELVTLYSASWPDVKFHTEDLAEGIVLHADRSYIKQALGNIIANAADATDKHGNVWICSELVKTLESKYCRIQIRDDGHGMADDVKSKVFSPYFTTKVGGTGLGLAIVEHIITAHGGSIKFDTALDAGTIFYIDIPSNGGGRNT